MSLWVGGRLGVLPLELNRLLIIVVVLSMALTPALDAVGRRAATYIESRTENKELEGEGEAPALRMQRLERGWHHATPQVWESLQPFHNRRMRTQPGPKEETVNSSNCAFPEGKPPPLTCLGFNIASQAAVSRLLRGPVFP